MLVSSDFSSPSCVFLKRRIDTASENSDVCHMPNLQSQFSNVMVSCNYPFSVGASHSGVAASTCTSHDISYLNS
jgi:hypothetical protein